MKKILAALIGLFLFSIMIYQMFVTRPIIVGKAPNITKRAFILMHGYGAAEDDLKRIAEFILNLDPRWTFVLVPGPYRVGVSGRSYYSVRSGKTKEDFLKKYAEERAKTRAIVDDCVKDLIKKGVTTEKLVIGGFSEGGIVATDYVLNAPERHIPSGFVFLSGKVEYLELEKLKNRDKPINAFVSHGENDEMVSIHESKTLIKALSSNKKNKITKVFFNGPHQISKKTAEELGKYLLAIP